MLWALFSPFLLGLFCLVFDVFPSFGYVLLFGIGGGAANLLLLPLLGGVLGKVAKWRFGADIVDEWSRYELLGIKTNRTAALEAQASMDLVYLSLKLLMWAARWGGVIFCGLLFGPAAL